MLPRFVIAGSAAESDPIGARELCAGLGKGEIVVFDKACLDFAHLFELLVRGVFCEMEFLTNNFDWSAASICDLYKSRWQIEVFFKQIKQTLQLCDFLGNSANAVRWQVWTALLMYVLLRFKAFLSGWDKSFTRLFTILRGVL